jgi:hypothetical protein
MKLHQKLNKIVKSKSHRPPTPEKSTITKKLSFKESFSFKKKNKQIGV